MRRAMAVLTCLIGACGAAAARGGAPEPPVNGTASLEELQSLGARETSYRLGEDWSVDLGRSELPADAYAPGRPIDAPRTSARLVLSLHAARGARFSPYIGAGVETPDYARMASGAPYEPGESRLMNFAATIVAGFTMEVGEGWAMRFKADTRKLGLGVRYRLN